MTELKRLNKILKYTISVVFLAFIICYSCRRMTDYICDWVDRDWYVTKRINSVFLHYCDPNSVVYELDGKNYKVIPQGVQLINNNEKWIIVKTAHQNAVFKNDSSKCDNGDQYWIVDMYAPIISVDSLYVNNDNVMTTLETRLPGSNPKEFRIISTGVIGPMDSVAFYKRLRDLKIMLRF